MQRMTATTLSRIATMLAAASACIASSTSCSAVAAHVSMSHHRPAAPDSAARRDPLPIPRAILRKFPNGTFYVLAGSDSASLNLWELSNAGEEIQLTQNHKGYGISSFGASRAGIVLADASTGADELARLTDKGLVPLKAGRASSPGMNASGQIFFTRPPYGKSRSFELVVRKSFTAKSTIRYKSRVNLVGGAWGPSRSIAVIQGGHFPGTRGPTPKLLVIDRRGKALAVATGFGKYLSNIIWVPRAHDLAVTSWRGAGEVITRSGSRLKLPAGWYPAAWNPSGSKLLVWGSKGRSLAIWSPTRPGTVSRIGALAKGIVMGKIEWLTTAVKL